MFLKLGLSGIIWLVLKLVFDLANFEDESYFKGGGCDTLFLRVFLLKEYFNLIKILVLLF